MIGAVHVSYDDPDLPDTGDGACCDGAAMFGPGRCTCWTPVHDLEQQAPPVIGPQQVRPDGMCGDCAYRPGSPEKADQHGYAGSADSLEYLAATGTPFTCHDQMRRIVRKVHPSGAEVPGHPAAYDPPTRGLISARTNGQPGFLCAGWDARRRAIEASCG